LYYKVDYKDNVSLQKAFSVATNLLSKLWTRLAQYILGLSNPNWSWQNSTISILFVLNSFINKRFITKSSD